MTGIISTPRPHAAGTDRRERPLHVRCFIITTSDRPDRHGRLDREIGRLGVPTEVVRFERATSADGFPSAGYRGVFESHLACLRRARELGVDLALIAEDDVVVVRRFRKVLDAVIVELASIDWTVLHLGHLSISPARRERAELLSEHLARCEGWEIYGAHLVAIRGGALSRVIDDFERRLLPGGHRISVDGVYNEVIRDEGRTALVCLPNLANQAPSPSGISPRLGLRQRLLRIAAVQRLVESAKRVGWDAAAALPPGVHLAVWNVGARLRSRGGGRTE